ncbi:hypothetical protein D3C86_1329210 [compost metagenome]
MHRIDQRFEQEQIVRRHSKTAPDDHTVIGSLPQLSLQFDDSTAVRPYQQKFAIPPPFLQLLHSCFNTSMYFCRIKASR